VGLIPLVADALRESRSRAEAGELGARLISAGQIRAGLPVLDLAWRVVGEGDTGAHMLRHALLAANTRLDLGRYNEVDEPLTFAERSAETGSAEAEQVLLLRLKLALRRNLYAALWPLAGKLHATKSLETRIEGALIVNSALRDMMDYDGLRESIDGLRGLRSVGSPKAQNGIDRALARSLAKIGALDEAHAYAAAAVRTSTELDSLRDVGNSHLALAEVERYRRAHYTALVEYREANAIARAIGNRDSLIWSLLGEIATHAQAQTCDRATAPLSELDVLMAEPGYEHPLEAAHLALLRCLLGLGPTAAEVVAKYGLLGIQWPKRYIETFDGSGALSSPIPL
jgi:hypothetical protein